MVTIPEGMPSVLVHDRLMRIPYLTGSIPVPCGRVGAAEQLQLPARREPGGFGGEDAAGDADRARPALGATAAGDRGRNTATGDHPRSIVEKETGKASERRMVAGVYTNRLKRGIALAADPTVIYPITRGRPLGRRILRSELHADNGYNTYVRAGLPIGPIANPGRDSIAAVLNPEPTRALFFVADGTGGHVFAETLQQHNANVARWYAIRRARGEM
jgi:UPF0755 protein